ncbi:hypothetical protein ATL41_2401 [Flavimobilis soli]|uniref:Winged helix-turn-helix domain-containing protein n=1 Tax=Flavimobilis soli TaxID=442709 RepID=A0A2A9EFD6_9MICO|nr:crosslink repair DNA glycosylase YcaQ family protein [Flavimobilis soli]PFG37634.1 hypothetical protein ATL41_2401 [Flavimobilis soli]
MAITRETLSLPEARRVALAAQRLHRAPAPGRPPAGGAAVGRLVEQMGVLQIDSVNVLARAHLVPVYSRLGPYPTAALDRAASRRPRRVVEAWGHQASYIPVQTYPLLAWRRREFEREAWGSIASVASAHPQTLQRVLEIVAARGPVTATEVQAEIEHEHPRGKADEWGWNWSAGKQCLEHLFFVGRVAVAERNASFERRYDLAERVLPPEVLAAPDVPEPDAVRALLEIGARAHGIGTLRCFQDYFRLRGPGVRTALEELVEAGSLRPVQVRGWDRPTYLHRDAQLPRSASATTFLSPFDPLVFERRRLQELFGVDYRIEIYTPAHKRVYGYYVLPLLVGERIAARCDLKADRDTGRLVVRSAHQEPGAVGDVVAAARRELARLAGWLGLGAVVVEQGARGDLADRLVGGTRGLDEVARA